MAASMALAVTPAAWSVPVPVDPVNTDNGIFDLFSATFDGTLSPCTGSSPSYCPFFGGLPGDPDRDIVITPNPTGVINAVPLGFSTTPPSGSYLDLTLNGANTQVTLAGGVIAFPNLTLTIRNDTIVNATGAGVVLDSGAQAAALDANGQAEFLVSLSPAIAADFSTFTTIVNPPNGSCSGPLCALISILTLDMVRYRLFIDYDPTFSYFTASFIGQTSNNSLLSITMNSTAPQISVTDSVAPANDLQIPYGAVTEQTSATQTVTVNNTGTAGLLMQTIGLADPLTAPFSLLNDTCTAATVPAAGACSFQINFAPGSIGTFSDSLDIPSNAANGGSRTLSVSGTGAATPVPNISVADSVAPTDDQQVPFGSAQVGTQANQSLTVSNDGNAALLVGQLAVANPLMAPFTIVSDTCSGQTIAPGGDCAVGVRFEPTNVGAASDSFDVPSNDPDDPTLTVAVSGTGTALAAADIAVADNVAPAADLTVPFGNLTIATALDRTVTVTNAGNADLVLGAVAGTNPLAAPFSLATDNCSNQTLAPAAACVINVRYSPAITATSTDSFNIPSNDADEANVTVNLSGTGIAEGDGVAPTPDPDGADSGFMAIDPLTLFGLAGFGVLAWSRRRSR
jgi:hypothetical protein